MQETFIEMRFSRNSVLCGNGAGPLFIDHFWDFCDRKYTTGCPDGFRAKPQ
ncbi:MULTISPECIES: hypothetical protein [unclassified Luteococcus]|uniref:hypothetical protein n=1 Tax=unclassified Luteococcus TaxID=2639923 RepID=UPI00313B953F